MNDDIRPDLPDDALRSSLRHAADDVAFAFLPFFFPFQTHAWVDANWKASRTNVGFQKSGAALSSSCCASREPAAVRAATSAV